MFEGLDRESVKRVLLQLKGLSKKMRADEVRARMAPRTDEGEFDPEPIAKAQDEAVDAAKLPTAGDVSSKLEELAASQDEAVDSVELPSADDVSSRLSRRRGSMGGR